MTTTAQQASPGVYVSDDVGVEVTDGVSSRVQLGLLPVGIGQYGLRVVSSDGTTVIIDGTSDIFKIAATGTSSLVIALGATGQTDVTLTGLGALPSTPAHLSFCRPDVNTSGANTYIELVRRRTRWFVANVSAGSPTSEAIIVISDAFIWDSLNGSSQCVVSLGGDNAANISAKTYFARYYVLQETAL